MNHGVGQSADGFASVQPDKRNADRHRDQGVTAEAPETERIIIRFSATS